MIEEETEAMKLYNMHFNNQLLSSNAKKVLTNFPEH
jgi:hypothetical protein